MSFLFIDMKNDSFETLCASCRDLWEDMNRMHITTFHKVSKNLQQQNAQRMYQLIDEITRKYQEDDMQGVDDTLHTWLKADTVWGLSWLNEIEQEAFYRITKQFMRDARDFDKTLCIEDITQAIRNVWIILILEKMFHEPLHYHPAIFAYSMLYPYTDNYLDAPEITMKEKRAFNDWLSRRLRAKTVTYEQEEQQAVNRLIMMIEAYYPRHQYPDVYHALLSIQKGQMNSLLQYDVKDDSTLLDISIAKGGASVLADGYLIRGTMNQQEMEFCTHFGFLLQVADDIQDLDEDLHNQYGTLLTTTKSKYERTILCETYFSYVHEVIQHICPNTDASLKDFVETNCRLLIYFSLMQYSTYYSKIFLHHVKKRIPLQMKDIERLLNKSQQFMSQHTSFQKAFDHYLQKEITA